jgi:L,D-transpeptidase YcbB
MPGFRVDRLLASTAIALLLALPATAAFAGSENSPTADANTAPRQDSQPGNQPALSEPAAKASNDAADSGAKSAEAAETKAETKPGETKPAEAKPSDATVTSAPATPEATPPAATAAAPAAPGPDAAIAEQLHEIGNGKFDRVVGSKKDRTQIETFYSSRNYAPLWIADGKANARATAAIDYLRHVDADGLDPADYPVPNFASLSTPADLADADMKLTAAVITYARHASAGRVHWSRVSGDIEYATPAAEPSDVLAAIAGASDVAATLDSYEPQTPGYRALKAKLADIRGGKIDKSKPSIASGPVLKIGMADERVPALRERLGVTGSTGTTYDKVLAEAVKKFQQQHDLSATGTVGAATLDALNGRSQPDHVSDVILANMERWRWMPHRFPNTYVIVNLPDFTLRVMHNGKQLWTTRIVIGKPEMPTPIMTAEMKYITVNPTWNVPPSIVNHEYLPALAQDPTVLARMGLRVDYGPDGVHISQPPGDKNALGRIRFNFPNKFLVYQHDTPDKYMFANDKRAFSHGCMRVQFPEVYASKLLALADPGERYSEARIQSMYGTNEININFKKNIWVHLTYQTAFVDQAGKLQFRDDVYGRDAKTLDILRGSERKVAEIPIERRPDASSKPIKMPVGMYGSGYGGGYDSGQGFFNWIFGGGGGPSEPVYRPRPQGRYYR